MNVPAREPIVVRPGVVDLEVAARCAAGGERWSLGAACRAAVERSAACVEALVARGTAVYGINTGFGKLAQTRIPDDSLRALQTRLVLSHCAGVGEPLAPPVVRLTLLLKATSLSHGLSGVRTLVVDTLLAALERDLLPVVPAQGSVGASGDLAPLAHLTAALTGIGEIELGGARMAAADALSAAGIEPLQLAPKEGLALLNGTQVSTSLGLWALIRAQSVFDAAIAAGAMTVDAARGSDTPFDARIHAARGQPAQPEIAARFRALLDGSPLRASHRECDKVQDPYCLRCQPQVMGACADQMRHAAQVLLSEANGVSDNPLVFADTGEALSGGNFHAEPVAFAADNLALAIAEIGSLSERRTAMLMDAALTGLPPFLALDVGLNSGLMIAQVTAAALVSENKGLAHPASVDSIPTSANQEDHVSMATGAARRLHPMIDNLAAIVAIEMIAAAQALEMRRPLRSSVALEALHARIRESVRFLDCDRPLAPDIARLAREILAGRYRG